MATPVSAVTWGCCAAAEERTAGREKVSTLDNEIGKRWLSTLTLCAEFTALYNTY